MSRSTLSRIVQRRGFVCPRCTSTYAVQAQVRIRSLHSTRPRQSLLSLLEQRGYIHQIAGDRNVLDRLLQSRPVGFYAGIDPTAPSLHLGHLLPLMLLFWLHRHGHHTVSLLGGATAKVGDPSGRLTSRAATTAASIDANFNALHLQLGGLWENVLRYGQRHGDRAADSGRRELLNNAQWLDNLNILDFLRLLGNGMRLGAMLGRDTVKNKMDKGDGMSFAEFTYPLLQGWDWWQMYQDRAVQIQIGGSDQYGNIVAGIDAVKYIAQSQPALLEGSAWLDAEGRLKDERTPMGLTVPLLTTASGEKFGKSAGNAVWLDRTLTSSFDLYGFLLRSSDEDVERYLKLFTFVSLADISTVMEEHRADPGKRKAQHLLAAEVLELVHGPEEATKTRSEHQAMRAPTLQSLLQPTSPRGEPTAGARSTQAAQRIQLARSLVHNVPFARILFHAGLVGTKSEGARTIAKGGAYVAVPKDSSEMSQGGADGLDFTPITSERPADAQNLIIDGLLILRLGKWKVRIIEVVDE